MKQTLTPLSKEQLADLEAKRRWVREHYEPDAQARYSTLEGKLNLLHVIISNGWVAPSETVKLQALGVTFGDALEQKLGMRWVSVQDEYGTDPALILEGTSIKAFPLTVISKRIENGQEVNVHGLFKDACETIARIKAGGGV